MNCAHCPTPGKLLSLLDKPPDQWSVCPHALNIGYSCGFLHEENGSSSLGSWLSLGVVLRVVFVCTGNICRSPFAEYLAKHLSDDHTVQFASAGTFAGPGNPAYSTGTAVAAEFGVDMTPHSATPLTAEVIANADVIYAMEDEHLSAVLELDPTAPVELLRTDGKPVPDPYGENRQAYLDIFALIDDAVRQRLHQIVSLRSSESENPKLDQ